jgi:hypothetical protein
MLKPRLFSFLLVIVALTLITSGFLGCTSSLESGNREEIFAIVYFAAMIVGAAILYMGVAGAVVSFGLVMNPDGTFDPAPNFWGRLVDKYAYRMMGKTERRSFCFYSANAFLGMILLPLGIAAVCIFIGIFGYYAIMALLDTTTKGWIETGYVALALIMIALPFAIWYVIARRIKNSRIYRTICPVKSERRTVGAIPF